jgi:hypothetical protein
LFVKLRSWISILAGMFMPGVVEAPRFAVDADREALAF